MATIPTKARMRSFSILRNLGAGQFGEALLVRDLQTNETLVVKRLKKRTDPRDLRESINEANALRRISNEHIVTLHDTWFESDHRLHMSMEYCDGGDLDVFLKRHFPLPESIILSFTAQLLRALDFCHKEHILHRDIKLQNVFLCRTGNAVKLGDFGLSKVLKNTDEAAQTQAGTPYYFSPEVATGRDYTRKTDIWSLGVLLYTLMTNEVPFKAPGVIQLIWQIAHAAPRDPRTVAKVKYSDELVDLVLSMLSKDPEERPTADELLEASVLQPVLRDAPWLRKTMILARRGAAVRIRSAPSLDGEPIGQVDFGQKIEVALTCTDSNGQAWFHLVSPMDGYCICNLNEKEFFVDYNNGESARLSPHKHSEPSPLPFGRPGSPFAVHHHAVPAAGGPNRGITPTRKQQPATPVKSPRQSPIGRQPLAGSPFRNVSPVRNVTPVSPRAEARQVELSPIRGKQIVRRTSPVMQRNRSPVNQETVKAGSPLFHRKG